MKGFLIKWCVNIIALFAVLHIVPGINVDRWETAIITALVLGLINVYLKPFIILFTLPLNILSLGLFTLIINGLLFYLVSKIVKGFYIVNFWYAFWGALCFSVISLLLNLLINPHGEINVNFHKYPSKPNPKYPNTIDTEGKVVDDDRNSEDQS